MKGKHINKIATIQVEVDNNTSESMTVHLDMSGGTDDLSVPASGTYYYNESSTVVGISINSQNIPKNVETIVTLPASGQIKVIWHDNGTGVIMVISGLMP